MATLITRWLLSILLVNVPNCFAPAPPAAPSLPDCYIPCDEKNNCADIHCRWDPSLDPQIPTNYSLHWEPAKNEEGHVINGTSLSGIIHRKHFSHGELHVWVLAKNQHGSTSSQKAMYITHDIMKLPPPNITWSFQDTLEVEWAFSCDELQISLGHCDVRYRTEADQVWAEEESGLHGYTFDSPQPCTVYEFQVRCSCAKGLPSDWSAIYRIQSLEAAPIGELDVWMDCGMSQAPSNCFLTWKRLPISQACGLILGYEVRLSYSNYAEVLVNLSTSEPGGQLVCSETQCRFNSSIKAISTASVSAYNTHGATEPSYLAVPIPGKWKNEQAIHLKMNKENLTVSWDEPSQLSDNLKEYVVQYKQAGCPPGQGFDWVKVNKNHTVGILKGQYKKNTPYQVSLFTISHSSKVHHLSSVIGYSLEGTPSKVQSFKVFSIADTHVTLLWKPVPLSMQNGVILYYQFIVDQVNGQKVHNVSASPPEENMTFKLHGLSPGQNYEVRIRAVTSAGPGENATVNFKTNLNEILVLPIPLLVGFISVVLICFLVILSCSFVSANFCHGENKACPLVPTFLYEKVPDARNSHILKHMMYQANDQLACICIPVNEPHPEISVLEVLEIQPCADRLTRPVVGDGCFEMEDDQREEAVTEECHRTDHRYGREEYSKMLDSDEEKDREEGWSSEEDEQPTSGYEKHFMPSALEVQVA
ncbi:interleukin 12 receptor, beta 2a, like [Plectropomus leopardus]|uniref:interleukin 12 receptor, beta 2a, like n=1 Tax=Plectropomus leopardus TaxID=160734 RepID=UPI001C4C6867|nr:interleukin 12 receptor, beta 2a, like [Plectropomus leopardus]